MAEFTGTTGPDIVTVASGDNFYGLGGDDEITVQAGGTAEGGAGNDKITVTGTGQGGGTVWYWRSPQAVLVDLEAGYALDGWGGRDTLVNAHNVHGASRPGDQFFGSQTDDWFYLGAGWSTTPARVLVDGRGGTDRVDMNPQQSGAPVFNASADGRVVTMYYTNFPNHLWELRSIEKFGIYNQATNFTTEFSVASLIDPTTVGPQVLLGTSKGWQTAALGAPKALSYSFMTAVPAHGGGDGGTGFTAFNAAQQQVVREVLAKLAQQTGLSFTEDTAGGGQLQFGINQQTATRGYSFNPSEVSDARAGDVWLDVETAAQLATGQEGYYVLLHELGHALGLLHPLPQTDTSGRTVLLNTWYDLGHTIMLTDAPAPAAWPTWFSVFDIQSLRQLYGTRSVAGGDDLYRIDDLAGRQFISLLDDGGTDTLSAQASTLGARIDLRPGESSSIGTMADGRAAVNNLVIGTTSWIENAVGTAFDDVLTGNSLNNRLTGGGGNDLIDGGTGRDAAVFGQTLSKYTVQRADYGGQWTVAAKDGVAGYAELRNVERLVFTDKALAFDTGAQDNAGQAALLLGAMLGRGLMLQKPEVLGALIGFIDAGFTVSQLAGALMQPIYNDVWTILAGGTQPQAIAGYLFKTVNGRDADAAELTQAVATMTQQPTGTYLAELAASPANQLQVGLTGLADTGLGYVEFPV